MRYLRAALVLVALAAGGWTVTQIIGGRDADNGDSVGRWTGPVPSPSLAGMPGPPVPAPTPVPEPTPSPEPAPPPPEPTAAPAPPVPEPERGEPPPAEGLVGAFLAGYRDGGGDPAWEEHLVNDVIPCESGWTLDPGGYHHGLAQFDPGTWVSARCSPDADWRNPYAQGCAVANWMAAIAPNYGSTAGWPGCWWR